MNELLSRLLAFWATHGVQAKPGTDKAELLTFQSANGIVLPEDMSQYFLHVNGMIENEMDPLYHLRFWSLLELKPVVDEIDLPIYASDKYRLCYVFADYSLWSHAYAIHLSNDRSHLNEVLAVGGETPKMVAHSFAEFVQLYLDRPEAIF